MTPNGRNQHVNIEVDITEVLNVDTPEESSLDSDEIEHLVDITTDIEVARTLRELAKERIDYEDLPRAECLLWIDEATVYALCKAHYRDNRDDERSEFTTDPNYDGLREQNIRELREGRHCAFCEHERVNAVKNTLANQLDVETTVTGW